MREFSSTESFIIKNRGKCWIIPKEQMPDDLYDPAQLTGDDVLLNGVEVRVGGVETFAIGRSVEHPYRLNFSILVSDKK